MHVWVILVFSGAILLWAPNTSFLLIPSPLPSPSQTRSTGQSTNPLHQVCFRSFIPTVYGSVLLMSHSCFRLCSNKEVWLFSLILKMFVFSVYTKKRSHLTTLLRLLPWLSLRLEWNDRKMCATYNHWWNGEKPIWLLKAKCGHMTEFRRICIL